MRVRYALLIAVVVSLSAGLGAVCGEPPKGSGQQRATAAAPGTPSTTLGRPVPVATLETNLTFFDEFPVLWLGQSFDSDGDGVGDMPLRNASFFVSPATLDPRTGKELQPETRAFYLVYGDCTPPLGRDSCQSPTALAFYPSNSPILPFAGSLRAGTTVQVRGTDASFSGGVFWMETADFVLNISVSEAFAKTDAERLRLATRMANQLYGANAKAAGITKTTDFRPKSVGTPAPFATRPPAPATRTPAPPAATATATVAAPPIASCCSLQLDMDPATVGVQPSLAVGGARDISIDIVLGDNAGNVSAFDVKLIYDDVKLAPLPNRGGLNGNPDFNETALGAAWNCDLGGSSPDIDPLTGAGHGVALLSCFTTGAGATVASPTVIGTLRLHAAGPVTTSIDLREVQFSDIASSEIGSCNPASLRAMVCTGGSIAAP